MKGINAVWIGVLGVATSLAAVQAAHAADATKVLNMSAQSEFVAHIDEYNSADGQAFIIDENSQLGTADSTGGFDPSWSIWTNAAGPVQVKFDVANDGKDGLLRHTNQNITGPNGEHFVKFRLVYQECSGSDAFFIGGDTAGAIPFGTEFTLPQDNANKAVCEASPGSLTIVNGAMNYTPFKGTFTAPVTVTVKDPV